MSRPTRVRGLGPRTPLSVAAKQLISSRLADAAKLVTELSRGPDPVVIHDLRVAIRRLRAALALFDQGRGELGRRAKELQDALGAVRDLQVEIAWLESLDRLRPQLDSLIAELRDEASEHGRRLEAALMSWQAEPKALPRALAGLKGRLGGKQMPRVLKRHLRRVEKHLEGVGRSLSVRGAHRARIAVKKLRYASELLGEVFPKAASVLNNELVPLQRKLGDLHDADVWHSHWIAEAARHEGDLQRISLAVAGAAARRRSRAIAVVGRDLARWRKTHVEANVRRQLKG
jgi:CHAD domain-containing protein